MQSLSPEICWFDSVVLTFSYTLIKLFSLKNLQISWNIFILHKSKQYKIHQ